MRTREQHCPFVARSWGARAILPALLLLGSSLPAWAANGDVLAISSVLAGKEITDLTFDTVGPPAGGSFWAVSKNTGRIFHLSFDLNTLIEDVPNPHGTGVFPNFVLTWGIAFRAISKTLFVLAQDGASWRVKEVKRDGTEVAAGGFTLTPPDPETAKLRGLVFDPLTSRFWYLDAQNDVLVQTDFTGAALKVVPLPGDVPSDTELRGEGLGIELDDVTHETRLYVAYGDIFHINPSRLIQLKESGESTGIEVPLTKLSGSGQLLGFQNFRVGAQGRRIAVVTSDGKIATVEQVLPQPVPPSYLTCALTLSNQVHLSWQNNGSGSNRAYGGEIQVLRNGVAFASIVGTTVDFVDSTPLEGTSTYSLKASDSQGGPVSPASFPCDVTVGTGGLVRWAPFPNSSKPFDLARHPDTGEVYVTDPVGVGGQGKIYKFDAQLALTGEVPSPWQRPGAIAFVARITIQNIDFTNLLAVGRTDGQLVKIMDVAGAEKTTLALETTAPITSLTYNARDQEFATVESNGDEPILSVYDSNGRFKRQCVLPVILNLPPIDLGAGYDPIQDTFLTVFRGGTVKEMYTGGNCVPTSFEFSLGSCGEGFAERGFFGGVEIAGNTLLICGRESHAILQVLIFPGGPAFRRGDFDRDDKVSITDAIGCAQYLFQGGSSPRCQDAADVNDDGILDVSDPVYLLFHLFLQGPPPPQPFPAAGTDPTFRDNIGCEE